MTDILEKKRLHSLDAFRGFTIAAMIVVNSPGDWDHVFAPLKHSAWNGCTPTDVVFPCFIFMMGISIVFAFSTKRLDKTQHAGIISKAFRRMLTLIGIGLGLQLFYHFSFSEIRYPGVLQRIGIVYFLTTLLYIKLADKMLPYILSGILAGYYLLACIIPGSGLAAMTPEQNIGAWFDHLVIPASHLAKFAYTDPCGLLGTLPTVGSAILGLLAGLVLKNKSLQPENKAAYLLIAGNLLILSGLIVNLFFPFNKPLWSSSYVLYTGGICMVAFAIFYWFIDIKEFNGKCWLLTVLGMNAISSYVLSEALPALLNLIVIKRGGQSAEGLKIFDLLFFLKIFSEEWASLFSAFIFLLMIWAIMYIFYRKKWIIKI
ncbi:DUF5009 domain-containing protein [uncultured Mucilaginibacter sp.]|uniref:acyltransferase family protein n=1 Tax=uncultured Mucilaginibacter sp. TaxID=797541 RepID=UPI0025E749BC|nr:DUF5009 domain-containing protein [uncultured Mucilaginibacter sp.]